MNDPKKMKAIFIALMIFAVAAFLGIVALAVFSFLSSGTGSRALLRAGIALSAVYLSVGIFLFVYGIRGKRS